MKRFQSSMGALVGGLLLMAGAAQEPVGAGEPPTVVVGTFDSRAVAVAYVNSDAFREYMRAQSKDIQRVIERAKSEADPTFVATLENLGPAMQQRLHVQGFGTASVDAIIAQIDDELPRIAKEAGVDVIVSKWAMTYRSSSARFVDVTGRIAAEFDPSERTLKMIQSTMEADPVPLDELDHDH